MALGMVPGLMNKGSETTRGRMDTNKKYDFYELHGFPLFDTSFIIVHCGSQSRAFV